MEQLLASWDVSLEMSKGSITDFPPIRVVGLQHYAIAIDVQYVGSLQWFTPIGL